MASSTTLRKPKVPATRRRREASHLRPQNQKLLRWLDSWQAAPDDLSEAWWKEFEADLEAHRVTFRFQETTVPVENWNASSLET